MHTCFAVEWKPQNAKGAFEADIGGFVYSGAALADLLDKSHRMDEPIHQDLFEFFDPKTRPAWDPTHNKTLS